MTQAKRKIVVDNQIETHYLSLKNLVKSNQKEQAINLFMDQEMLTHWQQLLHYAMSRRNCPVTSLIIELVYQFGGLQEKVFEVEISKLLVDVTFEFSTRVRDFMDTMKFEVEYAKLLDVTHAVHAGVRGRTGNWLPSLNERHFDMSYLKED